MIFHCDLPQKNTGDFSPRQAGDRWREATPPRDGNRGEIMAVVVQSWYISSLVGGITIGKP